jgi:hypothetical protein
VVTPSDRVLGPYPAVLSVTLMACPAFSDRKEVKAYLAEMAKAANVVVRFREEAENELAIDDAERNALAQLLLQDNVHPLRYITKSTIIHCDRVAFALQTKEGQVRSLGLCLYLSEYCIRHSSVLAFQVAKVDARHVNLGLFTQADKSFESSFRVSSLDVYHTTAPFAGISSGLHERLGKTLSFQPVALQLPDAPVRLQQSPRYGGFSKWLRIRSDLFSPRSKYLDVPSLRSMLRDDLTVGILAVTFQTRPRVRRAVGMHRICLFLSCAVLSVCFVLAGYCSGNEQSLCWSSGELQRSTASSPAPL